MSIATDVSVAANGDIRYTGSTANYTVLELHRFLQELAANPTSSGDDLLDINDVNPSSRSTDQIITLNAPYNIDDTMAQHLYGGSITQAGGDVIYSGIRVIGSVGNASTQLIVVQNGAALTNFWGTGINTGDGSLNRFLIKTRTGGSDIDGKRVIVMAREYGDTYAEFAVTLGQGESVAAISTQTDINNQTSASTIATAAAAIGLTFGYTQKDLNNGNGSLDYLVTADLNADSIADWYEISKWIGRRGNTTTYSGIQGQLLRRPYTHQIVYDTESGGPFSEGELLTFGNGATARLIGLDDNGTTGNLYVHMISGEVPADNATITGGTSSATALVNGTPSQVTGTFNGPFGNFAGGTFFGQRGVFVEDIAPADVQKISLIDLAGGTQTPPNLVSVAVLSVASGDQVLLGRDNGSGSIETTEYTLAAGNNSGNGTIVVKETISSDTPATGSIRIEDPANPGRFHRYAYTSWTGSTFTLSSTLTTNYVEDDNAFVPFIDGQASGTTISNTIIYASDVDVVGTVRNATAQIVPFPISGTITSSGFSATAIRASDA